jgi:tetratricopeptide (TPR) repeat protein
VFCPILLAAAGGCAGAGAGPSDGGAMARPDNCDGFDAATNRPPTAQTLYAMGRILATQRRDSECEAVFRRVVREHPEFLPARSALAEVLLRGRRPNEAIELLSTGLRYSPRDPVLLNDLGMCYMIKGAYENALRNFAQAAAASPSDARYRANTAAALGLLGRYDESLSAYLRVLAPADAHYNLAVLCEARRDHDRAIAEYRRANELRQHEPAPEEENAAAPASRDGRSSGADPDPSGRKAG